MWAGLLRYVELTWTVGVVVVVRGGRCVVVIVGVACVVIAMGNFSALLGHGRRSARPWPAPSSAPLSSRLSSSSGSESSSSSQATALGKHAWSSDVWCGRHVSSPAAVLAMGNASGTRSPSRSVVGNLHCSHSIVSAFDPCSGGPATLRSSSPLLVPVSFLSFGARSERPPR